MKKQILLRPLYYPIQPFNIGDQEVTVFSGPNTNRAAHRVMRFCKSRGSWDPFTKDEIKKFIRETLGLAEEFSFFTLDVENGYIVNYDDHYYLTHEFVAKYFLAAPAL